jgi:hypothetical protein
MIPTHCETRWVRHYLLSMMQKHEVVLNVFIF